jgi:hypothetical protein
MNSHISVERCQGFIQCNLQSPHAHFPAGESQGMSVVTLSRQAGSGGHAVAGRLAVLLEARKTGQACPWTVFDRNLVEKVLDDHNLPKNLAKFMPEDRMSEIADTMDELFGLHPPSWTLVHKTADTILHLAHMGNVIIIGRGANIILSKLPYVFNVRLVGSLEKRTRYISETAQLSEKEAREKVQFEDLGRRRYLRKYFNKDVDDPLLYHLTINTDLVSFEEATRMIADAVCPKPHGAL